MGDYRLNEAKELAIDTWISTILSGLTIIWDKPKVNKLNVIRPSLPYATMNISQGSRSIGKPDQIWKETDIYTQLARKVMTLTVNIYALNAYLYYMEKLINSLSLSSVQTILRVAGMASWGHSGPVDVSQLLDTQFEPRVSADFFLAYATETDDEAGEIHKVTYESSELYIDETTIDIN